MTPDVIFPHKAYGHDSQVHPDSPSWRKPNLVTIPAISRVRSHNLYHHRHKVVVKPVRCMLDLTKVMYNTMLGLTKVIQK